MSNSSGLLTRMASPPFDGSTGDVTLRSSDGVDFHCFSQILVAASPVFEGMVAVGNAFPDPSSSSQNRPIVPMSEDSNTLDFLLRFIYPIPKPSQPRSLEETALFLQASLKYLMDYPVSILTQELLALAPKFCMQVWAIGCRLMLEEIARAGAQNMLRYRILGSYTHLHQFVPIAEFIRYVDARGVSAADYYRLQMYHSQHGTVDLGFTFTQPDSTQMQDQQGPDDNNDAYGTVAFFSSLVFPDIICRASDGKTFPAHRGLLCMNSSVLKDMIVSDASTRTFQQSITTLDLAEEGPVLAHLLRLCYPGDPQLPHEHYMFLAVLKAAENYDMTRIVDLLVAKWESVSAPHPLSLCFAAMQYGFPELAKSAAQRVPASSYKVYVREMERSPAIHWQWVTNYWSAATTVVDKLYRETKLQTSAPLVFRQLGCVQPQTHKTTQDQKTVVHPQGMPCEASCDSHGPLWVQQRRNELNAEVRQRLGLAREMPSVEELFQRSVAPTLSEKPWCPCCFNIAQDLVRMGSTFRQRLIHAIDDVPLVT